MIIGFSSLTLITGKRLAEMSQDIDFKRLVLASYSREYLKVVYGVCLCSSMNFVFLWINEKFGSDPKNILAGVLLTLVLFEHGRVTLGKKSPEVEFPERWIVRNLHLLGLSMLAGLILYV
jgi:hypothetical protein